MKWPKEREQRLTSMWAAGDSCGYIAQELKVSRNAVIGKAHRLFLYRRTSKEDHNPVGKTVHRRVNTPKLLRREKPKTAIIEPIAVKALMDLSPSDCHWPIGNFFCGAIAVHRQPYCPYHMKRSNRRWDDAKRKRNERSQAAGEAGPPKTEAAA